MKKLNRNHLPKNEINLPAKEILHTQKEISP